MLQMKRLIFLLVALMLVGCDSLIEPIPTATPTVYVPPLEATTTPDIRPPTPISFEDAFDVGGNNPTAAAAPAESDLLPDTVVIENDKPNLVSIPAPDGTTMSAELYLANNGGRSGVVLLQSPFDDWQGLPTQLRDAGYNVLVADVRIPMLTGDFDAILDTFVNLAGVDANNISVIGAENTADNALEACSTDTRCKTLVMFTPRQSGGVAYLPDYNPRSLLIVVSLTDAGAALTAEALRVAASDDSILQVFEDAGTGSQIIAPDRRPDTRDLILQWLDRHLD